MSYGIEILQSNGLMTYSSDDVTWNQVDFFLCAAGQQITMNYPALIGRNFLVTQIMIDAPPITRRAVAPTITVSGNTVSVSGGSENAFILVLMR